MRTRGKAEPGVVRLVPAKRQWSRFHRCPPLHRAPLNRKSDPQKGFCPKNGHFARGGGFARKRRRGMG
jgi:hypothetical protein